MAVSKVELFGKPIIDITDSTTTPQTLLKGNVGYGADGERVVGEAEAGSTGDSLKIIDIGEVVFGSSFELTQEQGEALFNGFSVIKATFNDSGTAATYFLVKNAQVNNIAIYSCAVFASGAAVDLQILLSDGKYTAYTAIKSIPAYDEVDDYPEEGLLVWNAREYGWVLKPKDEVIQDSLPNYTKGDKPYTIKVSTELPTSDDKSKITFTY